MYKLLSFDVYGTLINTPPTNVKAFRLILEQAGASNIDALAFYQFWESRNIVHYREPYRSYREIGRIVWADRPEDLLQYLPQPEDLPPGFDPPRPISVTFIPATVFDNPALLRVNPEYLAWLLSLPTLERE